jgi:hypothetical protein
MLRHIKEQDLAPASGAASIIESWAAASPAIVSG